MEQYRYCLIDKKNFSIKLTNVLDLREVSFIHYDVFCDVDFLFDKQTGHCFIEGHDILKYWACDEIDVSQMKEKPFSEYVKTYTPNWFQKKIFGVNYTRLNEGASCFNDNTCITISRNVEALSPQALISVVPTVLY